MTTWRRVLPRVIRRYIWLGKLHKMTEKLPDSKAATLQAGLTRLGFRYYDSPGYTTKTFVSPDLSGINVEFTTIINTNTQDIRIYYT